MTYSADFGQHVGHVLGHKSAEFFQPHVLDKRVSNSDFQPCSPWFISNLFQPLGHVYNSQISEIFQSFTVK
jgi:hypothetical protein